jgi:hypothetical protein
VKKFILKSILLFILVAGFTWLIINHYTQGYVDAHYKRFTTGKKTCLILGSSRAAQGLQPQYIFEGLADEKDYLNFSFTVGISPYGEIYLDAIKSKLNTDSDNGYFILEVSPIMISSKDTLKKEGLVREAAVLGKQYTYNQNPNWEYILRQYEKPLYKLILNNNKKDENLELHDDGWLEVNVSMDEKETMKRKKRVLKDYEKRFEEHSFDSDRLHFLVETIKTLQEHGSVYLVRMPIGDDIKNLEENYMPDFDDKMEEVSSKTNILYLNLYHVTTYQTTDGNHLYKADGKRFSQVVNQLIVK